jgi:F-type H+-transporting ATPase subunit a
MGCSTRIMLLVGILLLVFFVVGFAFGPIGLKLFNIEPPEFLKIGTPHTKLPAEAIFHVSSFGITNTLLASWLTIIVLFLVFFFATRKMKLVPGRLQNFAEIIVEGLLNFVEGAAEKKHSRVILPVIATIFLYVLTNAYLALLPFFGTIGFHEGEKIIVPILRAANTDINLPLSIALISVLFVEYLGFRSFGPIKYVNSFFNFGKLVGGFATLFKGKIRAGIVEVLYGVIYLFIGVLEVVSHFIRVISFTFRLFGNMTAGEILLVVVCFLVPLIAVIPFYGLEIFLGFIQALIFAGLTLVFSVIALTPHGEEEHIKEEAA